MIHSKEEDIRFALISVMASSVGSSRSRVLGNLYDIAYNKGIDDATIIVIKAFMPVGEINGQRLEYIISELEVLKKNTQ